MIQPSIVASYEVLVTQQPAPRQLFVSKLVEHLDAVQQRVTPQIIGLHSSAITICKKTQPESDLRAAYETTALVKLVSRRAMPGSLRTLFAVDKAAVHVKPDPLQSVLQDLRATSSPERLITGV